MLIIEKLLLERIRFYIELFRRLFSLFQMFYKTFANAKGPNATSIIDNVNYADIVPVMNKPEADNLLSLAKNT